MIVKIGNGVNKNFTIETLIRTAKVLGVSADGLIK